jgi:hypothetical protein
MTNDPNRPWLQVSVTGIMNKFAEIRPDRVRLIGPAGTTLFAEVEIVPKENHPFVIEGVQVKDGSFIKYEVTKQCTDKFASCVLRVENTRKEKGRYADVLYVKTNSELCPKIPIYVTGIIQ